MQRVIPFPDTTDTVRCVEIEGKLYASPIDYIQIFCKHPFEDNKEKASKNAYYILNKYVDMESLSPWGTHHKFEGIGQHSKMVLTLEGVEDITGSCGGAREGGVCVASECGRVG